MEIEMKNTLKFYDSSESQVKAKSVKMAGSCCCIRF
jgi:hypothetical protein